MPVVEISYSKLQRLLGRKISKKIILDNLPFLGLDIESEDNDIVRVEYSPNRPDYSTDIGVSLGLQGLLGIKKGGIKLKISNKEKFLIKVDPTVSQIRPFVTGIIAKGGQVDADFIKQLMAMQEDLHFGIGRRRVKSSIGIHDLDKIKFPLVYTTASHTHKFTPLNSTSEQTISQILQNTDVGKNYGHIVVNSPRIPIILDSMGETVSFPPIINAALTTVTTNTKNLFVEVTGISKKDAEDMLAVVATILQAAGFKLYSVSITGAKNSTPLLKERKMVLDPLLANSTLGIELKPSEIISSLKKSRIDAFIKNKKITCIVPSYRFDILGEMDIVEEIALGYGIQKLSPILSPSQTIGQENTITTKLQLLTTTMIGLGYSEVMNSSLTSNRILYETTNREAKKIISVSDSKSQEHTILRDSLLPGLLDILSKNIHEPYPQNLFEIGTVFLYDAPIKENINISAISANRNTNFSEIKSVLQSLLKFGANVEFKTKTSSHPTFESGRVADIVVNEKHVGIIGEINSKIIDTLKIRVPVVAFEIQLSGLIFD